MDRLARGTLPVYDPERLAVQSDGLFVGEDLVRVVTSQLQVVNGAVLLASGGKVLPEDGCQLLQAVGGVRLQVPGGAPVQQAALRAQQAVIGRVPDQGVAEPITTAFPAAIAS